MKTKKLIDKLSKLNQVNREVAEEGLKDMMNARDRNGVIYVEPPGKAKFESAIFDTSNSGALDIYGLSLKVTKKMLKACPLLTDALYNVFVTSLQ